MAKSSFGKYKTAGAYEREAASQPPVEQPDRDDFTDMGLTRKHKLNAEDTKHILESAKEYKIRKQKNHK